MRVIVTRPRAQGEPFARELRALGVQALTLPLIDIAPAADGDAQAVRRAWADLPRRALVMFVSANAVQHFFAAAPGDEPWPEGTLAGASGPATSAALRAAGVPAACVCAPGPAGPFDTDTLWQQQLAARSWAGREVLVVRGVSGRDWLAAQLSAAGAQVEFVAAYRRQVPSLSAAEQQGLQAARAEPAAHAWHFGSSQALDHLRLLAGDLPWGQAWALVTHARIATHARSHGFGRVDEIGWRASDVVAALARSA